MAANNNTPGPKRRGLGGNLFAFRDDPLAFLEDAASYGEISHIRIGNLHAYLLNDPDLIHQVLVAHPEHYHKSRILKRTTNAIIGSGLLTSEGEFHKRQRRMIQPAFHHQRLAGYTEIMARRTADLLDGWHDGQTFDASKQMTKLTLQIVSEALFGADVSGQAEEIGAAISMGVETVGSQIRNPTRQFLPPWLPVLFHPERREAAAFIRRTVMGMIDARKQDGNLEDRSDLLSMLLLAMDDETSATMTMEQVYDEAITLFIAGHETTAIALSWTLYLLATHPKIEAKLLDEIERVLGDRTPTLADLPHMKMVEYTIKESMRLYPPAWVMSRINVEDVNLGGYTIPKGSGVLMSQWVTHRDPRWFDDPLVFNPERWAADASGLELEKRILRYAYFPFGGGPRICIGQPFAMMEMQVVLPMILQRYGFSLVGDQEVVPEPLITLRQRHGLRTQIHARQRESIDMSYVGISQPVIAS